MYLNLQLIELTIGNGESLLFDEGHLFHDAEVLYDYFSSEESDRLGNPEMIRYFSEHDTLDHFEFIKAYLSPLINRLVNFTYTEDGWIRMS